MILPKTDAAPDRAAALALLDDTARHVKIMKASWLRVAMNLQRIRAEETWRLCPTPCSTFEEYVYGVLDIQRGVARRMLEAVGYTADRRPELLQAVNDGREDVHVPSYDVLNQLRRAEGRFEGREGEFDELAEKVYSGDLGRTKLQREIDDRLTPEGTASGGDGPKPWEEGDGESAADATAESAGSGEPDSLRSVVEELKAIEGKLIALEASGEAKKLLFELVELLEREAKGARPARA